MRTLRPMPLQDDSYQYLSVADNLNHSQGVSTSLVHFDSERSHGNVPAPLTTFPPGYPVVIAGASHLTGSLESAARLLSVLCYAGTVALLAWALILTGTGIFVRQVVLCLFAFNAVNLEFATGVLTEPLYTLASTGAVVLLIWELRRPSRSVLFAAYTLAGLSYWIRYAGLFLIAALISYAFLRFLTEKSQTRFAYPAAAGIPVLLAGIIMARNYASVGTWKGGNDLPVHNPLQSVAGGYIRAQWHLLLGEHPLQFGAWEILLLCGLIGAVAISMRALRPAPPGASAPVILVILCLAVYSVGIFYVGLTTSISFVTRMFLPLLPLYALLAARWASAHSSVVFKAALCLILAGYIGGNARDLYQPLSPAEYQVMASQFAEPAAGGQPLTNWIDSHIPRSQPVFAAEGQAVGYLLHRPVVSLVGARYSREHWECGPLKTEMQRFHSRYLILYKGSPPESNSARSQFLDSPVSKQLTCGFEVAAETRDLRILQRTDVQ